MTQTARCSATATAAGRNPRRRVPTSLVCGSIVETVPSLLLATHTRSAPNRLIDRALAEPDQVRRASLWGEIDQRIMQDAPLVPLIWESFSFQWASRVHGSVYDPWTVGPDLTAVWLDPPSP